MNWIQEILNRTRKFFNGLFRHKYKVKVVEESLPSKLVEKYLYLVVEDGFEEYTALVCPCGCKKILYLNLIPDEKPCWKITIHKDKTASLQPSVWRKVGCHSHFWIKRGIIHWCK